MKSHQEATGCAHGSPSEQRQARTTKRTQLRKVGTCNRRIHSNDESTVSGTRLPLQHGGILSTVVSISVLRRRWRTYRSPEVRPQPWSLALVEWCQYWKVHFESRAIAYASYQHIFIVPNSTGLAICPETMSCGSAAYRIVSRGTR